jgi:cytidylate kinase
MKREYDFSNAVRGRFYKPKAQVRLPIYLDARVQKQLERIAKKKGKDIGQLVNQIVKKDIEILEELA